MLGDNKKTSLSSEEFMDLVGSIERSTSISDLLIGASQTIGVKHSSYHHFPAVGAFDFKNIGVFHEYNVPQDIINYYSDNAQYDGDPVIVAAFAKGHFFWLSDSVYESHVIKAGHEKLVHQTMKIMGDGLCCPLYGPDNRKGYAFVGFGRDKAEFDPIMPYQIQALIQTMHIQYCLLIKGLQRQINLTGRESEVLELMSYGKSNPDIGLILGISPRTVASYVSNVFLKLDTTDRVSAAMRAQTIEITI